MTWLLGLVLGALLYIYGAQFKRTFVLVNSRRKSLCRHKEYECCDGDCGHWFMAFCCALIWPYIRAFNPNYRFELASQEEREEKRMAQEVQTARAKLELDKKFSQHRTALDQIAAERRQLEEREAARVQNR